MLSQKSVVFSVSQRQMMPDSVCIRMTITVEDIRHIASLARLGANDESVEQYAEQLNRIMCLIEQMNQIDTSCVEPMAHPQDMTLRFRDDEVVESDQRKVHLALAPETGSGLYLVPQVIEQDA